MTMAICTVSSGEDFTAQLTDRHLADYDVELVSCGPDADYKVRVVYSPGQADRNLYLFGATPGEGGYGRGPYGAGPYGEG